MLEGEVVRGVEEAFPNAEQEIALPYSCLRRMGRSGACSIVTDISSEESTAGLGSGSWEGVATKTRGLGAEIMR